VFQALSFIIAAALIVKAAVALAIPHRFYASRQRQYASAAMPMELMVPPAIIVAITSIAWYATLAHYRPWGWIVTATLTLLCSLSLRNLTRWRRHRETMSKVVAHPRVWIVDCVLLVAGAGFAALGLFVYAT
jgi:ABC-type spermidine/putrescine transport system permease subunit II